jgi:hypothetical protein
MPLDKYEFQESRFREPMFYLKIYFLDVLPHLDKIRIRGTSWYAAGQLWVLWQRLQRKVCFPLGCNIWLLHLHILLQNLWNSVQNIFYDYFSCDIRDFGAVKVTVYWRASINISPIFSFYCFLGQNSWLEMSTKICRVTMWLVTNSVVKAIIELGASRNF